MIRDLNFADNGDRTPARIPAHVEAVGSVEELSYALAAGDGLLDAAEYLEGDPDPDAVASAVNWYRDAGYDLPDRPLGLGPDDPDGDLEMSEEELDGLVELVKRLTVKQRSIGL